MAIDRANCYWCFVRSRPERERVIDHGEVVYDSLCGHLSCATETWHPICLMEFRESKDRAAHQHGANTPPILLALAVIHAAQY